MAKIKNKVSLREMKKELKSYDHKALVTLVADLYKLNDENKHFLSAKFGGEETLSELFDYYKKEITYEFFPDKGWPKLRLSEAKNAISNFKKITGDEKLTFALMLHYVEMGTEFTYQFGDIDGKFYNSMAVMFEKFMLQCQQDEDLFKQYKGRLLKILDMAEPIGWDYGHVLADYYFSLKPEDE